MTCLVERETKADPEMYVLTVDQMIDNEYPVPTYMLPEGSAGRELEEGWVEVPEYQDDEKKKKRDGKAKVYALDCEMVRLFFLFSLSLLFLSAPSIQTPT